LPLNLISSNGGSITQVTKFDEKRGESTHRWPVFLPDGRHFVYLVSSFGSSGEKSRFGIYASSIDGPGEKFLLQADSNVGYADGQLVFARGSTLYAVAFDPEKLEVTGTPTPITDELRTWPQVQWSEFAVSKDLLLYQTGAATGVSRIAWFDRSGKRTNAIDQAGYLANPRISPDGQTVAFDVTDLHTINADIALLAKGKSVARRVTFDAGAETQPVWSPDGKSLYYFSWAPSRSIAKIAADGRSKPVTVISEAKGFPLDVTADGASLVMMDHNREKQFDLNLVSINDPRQQTPLVSTVATETDARISPDGSLLAYTSNESGRSEIYLTTFPGAVGKWQVSNDGGREARWRRDGRELYYLDLQKRVISVSLRPTNPPEIDLPVPLFRADVREAISGNDTATYDVAADGQSFVINVTEPIPTDTINVVLNWRSGISGR
jgi:hypothetical protein